MQLSLQDFKAILQMGIQLTVETDSNKLLGRIVEQGMKITHCDASVLFLYNKDLLQFKIMAIASRNIRLGMNGENLPNLPPVPYEEDHVCAYAAMQRQVVNIPDVYNSREFDFSGPRKYDSLIGYKTHSMLVIPMENNKGELLGILQMINAQDEQGQVIPFDPQYEIIIRALGSLAAIALTNIDYLHQLKEQLQSFVEAMATAVDERTPYNGSHTRKVAEYAQMLACKVDEKFREGKGGEPFDDTRLEKLELAAQLHDIGKMVTPRSVMNRASRLDREMEPLQQRYRLLACCYENDYLKGKITREEYEKEKKNLDRIQEFVRKIDKTDSLSVRSYEYIQQIAALHYRGEDGEEIPFLTDRERECLSVRKGTLTAADRKIMENHVVMTSKILSKVYFSKEFEDVPLWAGQHHEFLDGSGYPNHLKAPDLGLETRILTISDIYDALTSRDRPYKRPMPKEKAIFVLKMMAQEGKLDPQLVSWMGEVILSE